MTSFLTWPSPFHQPAKASKHKHPTTPMYNILQTRIFDSGHGVQAPNTARSCGRYLYFGQISASFLYLHKQSEWYIISIFIGSMGWRNEVIMFILSSYDLLPGAESAPCLQKLQRHVLAWGIGWPLSVDCNMQKGCFISYLIYLQLDSWSWSSRIQNAGQLLLVIDGCSQPSNLCLAKVAIMQQGDSERRFEKAPWSHLSGCPLTRVGLMSCFVKPETTTLAMFFRCEVFWS